jgi:hypothetical protein
MESTEQISVIVYDINGIIDEIFLDTKNAKKQCSIHNPGYFDVEIEHAVWIKLENN